MRERETIYAVYKYITADVATSAPAYYLFRCFDHLGPIDAETMHSRFKELFPEEQMVSTPYFGPFPNLSVLNQFAFSLAEELNANKACLLSLSDFNSLLDCVGSIAELSENMIEVGTVIDNINKSDKRKSIFSKILG